MKSSPASAPFPDWGQSVSPPPPVSWSRARLASRGDLVSFVGHRRCSPGPARRGARPALPGGGRPRAGSAGASPHTPSGPGAVVETWRGFRGAARSGEAALPDQMRADGQQERRQQGQRRGPGAAGTAEQATPLIKDLFTL